MAGELSPTPEELDQLYQQNFPAIGFKIHDDKFQGGVADYLIQNNIKIICIQRFNTLEYAVSRKLARQTQRWFQVDDTLDEHYNTPIELSILEYKNFQHHLINFQRFIQQFPHKLMIAYENLCDRQDETITQVLDYLSLPKVQLQSNLKKQRRKPVKELISNYEELTKFFI
jgi:LPS sulfotransferase NodH